MNITSRGKAPARPAGGRLAPTLWTTSESETIFAVTTSGNKKSGA